MYNPRLDRWTRPNETEGLLLFAQRVQECLFDYALDSYKAPALNTHSRCNELRRVIRDVTDGRIASPNIRAVLAELVDSLRHDAAAKALLGNDAEAISSLKWWSEDTYLLKTQAEMLRGYLWKGAYERELVRQLREVIKNGKRKRDILALTTSLVVEWINVGFSRDYTYSSVKRFFFGIGGPEITATDVFDEFIKIFERGPEKNNYEVLLKVSQAWKVLLRDTPGARFEVLGQAPAPRGHFSKERRFLKEKHDGVFLIVRDVKAYDPSRARSSALALVSTVADLGGCHAHRSPLTWAGDALVWEKNHPTVIKEPTRAIHKEDECSAEELPAKFARTLVSLSPGRIDEESWSRFSSSLALHSAAIKTQDVSVQLSSLWAALEAILPAKADESKIGAVQSALVPILSRHYVRKLLGDLGTSLGRCCGVQLDTALAGLPNRTGDRLADLGSLIAIDSNKPGREMVYAALTGNPLIKHRVMTLKEALQSGGAILQLIETHRVRVEWHLRRIYRTRNLLLHSGTRTAVVDSLVENLHSYFHGLLASVEAEFASNPPAGDIDSALLRIKQQHATHVHLLSGARDEATTADNVARFLFG